MTLCRSALYMPASNSRALTKGSALPTDAVIIDLEDSIAPEGKAAARQAAVFALTQHDYGSRLRVLRVNGLGTPWHVQDLELLNSIKPDALLLPKVESPQCIAELSDSMDRFDADQQVSIWAMMETPTAVLAAADIARQRQQYSRLAAFCIGNNDLAKAAGMQGVSDRELLMPWLMHFMAAARANDLMILDGVYNNFKDAEGFAAECAQGAAMGMDGKTLIHPTQINAANSAFSPSDAALREAQAIVAAFSLAENVNAGVVQVDGRMVERLHLEMARELLARHEQIVAQSHC